MQTKRKQGRKLKRKRQIWRKGKNEEVSEHVHDLDNDILNIIECNSTNGVLLVSRETFVIVSNVKISYFCHSY